MKNKIVDKLKKIVSIDTVASIACSGCPMKELCNKNKESKEKEG